MSVRNYHYTLRKSPEECSSHLLLGGSLNAQYTTMGKLRTIRWPRDSKWLLDSGPLNMQPIGCPETSRNYHYSLCKNTEECSSHLLLGGSLNAQYTTMGKLLYAGPEIRNNFWILDRWTCNRLVAPKRQQRITTTRCVTTQKSALVIYFATEAWNHTVSSLAAKPFPFSQKLMDPKIHKMNLFKIKRGWTRWGQSKIKGGSHWSIA